jgi:hypothetical protein
LPSKSSILFFRPIIERFGGQARRELCPMSFCLAGMLRCMQIPNANSVSIATALLALGITATALPAAGQATVQSCASGDRILAELVRHNELRNARLREYSAVRTYAVTDSSGNVNARESVLMEYVAPDKTTFVTITEEGSDVVRRLVLNRLMESEASAAAGEEHFDGSIAPANYTFHLVSEEDLGNHHCFVVEAIPKRKDKYLFVGKIWIDSTEFASVKIAGHPVKDPSFWVTRADFVREYEKTDDFWLPTKDETVADVRLYGKKILTVEYHTDSVNGAGATTAVGLNPEAGYNCAGHRTLQSRQSLRATDR